MKPSHRLARAMSRLSRNRWLHPDEVKKISRNLASSMSGSPSNVIKAAFAYTCEFVGMIDGEPPFYPTEYGYLDFLKWIEKGNKRTPSELVILKLKLKGIKNGN